SLKYREMFAVKTLVQQGLLQIPKIERASLKDCLEFDDEHYPMCFLNQPASHLAMQMATVKDTGKMVDKGDGYTDDLYRALSLAVHGLLVEEYEAALLSTPDDIVHSRPTAFAVSSLNSGGGGSWGSGGGRSSGSTVLGGYLPGRK